jgi:hypothetical protein
MTPSKQIPKPLSAEMEKAIERAIDNTAAVTQYIRILDYAPVNESVRLVLRTLALAIRKEAHEEAATIADQEADDWAPTLRAPSMNIAKRIRSLSEEVQG